jgi:hypothetical protein
MNELKERFSLADEIRTRDLWGEARRRAVEERPAGGRPEIARSPDRHRLVTGAVAFAVFAAAALFALGAFRGDIHPRPGPAIDPPPVDLAADLGPGWSEFPPPPEVRSAAATAWTGSQLIVWGGYVFDGGGDKTPTDDGFIFDGESRSWGAMPAGPLSSRSHAAAAWTGEELLIWGGFTGDDCCQPSEMFLNDGAAYDPVAQRWRTLPPAPLGERAPFSVWTGEELIVWGSTGRELYLRDGAAYDPSSDSWRAIAEAPLGLSDATAVWTGEEMIIFGSSLDGNNRSQTPTAIGLAYEPARNMWREISASELSPQAHTVGWPGSGEMIAWDYEHGTAAYDPRTDAWRRLDDVPLRFYECFPQSATIPGHVFGNFCGQLALYSAADDAWTEITRDDLRDWVIEPAAAGSAFLVKAHSFELSDEVGKEFDTRMLAYVPRRPDASGGGRDSSPFVPATETTGDTVQMPLVFPDGTRATLVYAAELRLAELGIQPDVSYVWREDPAPRFPIVFLHDRDAFIARFVEGATPVATINSYRRIEIWAARGNDVERRFWLRYHLPSWTVLVSVQDAVASATDVAAALELRETGSGFPLVQASGPIALAEGFGEAEGPQLGIGDGAADPSRTSLDPLILLSPGGCGVVDEEISPSGEYASLCLGGGRVFVSIYGDAQFVRSAFETTGLEGFLRT